MRGAGGGQTICDVSTIQSPVFSLIKNLSPEKELWGARCELLPAAGDKISHHKLCMSIVKATGDGRMEFMVPLRARGGDGGTGGRSATVQGWALVL